jgi:hypothetical protein
MAEQGTALRDVTALKVDRVGRVEKTGDPFLPFRVVDELGVEVDAVGEFLQHMLADDASPASLRSYAYELLGEVAAIETTMAAAAQKLEAMRTARETPVHLRHARRPPLRWPIELAREVAMKDPAAQAPILASPGSHSLFAVV